MPADASLEEISAMRSRLGLDRPLHEQLLDFLAGLLRGDLGTSIRYGRPAMELVLEAFPATLKLAGLAFTILLLVAIPTGILAAVHRDTAIDKVLRTSALIGQCFPSFWLGLMLIIIFALTFPILPPSGSGSFKHIVLPAVAVGLYYVALTARLLRAAMLEVLDQDYIRTARSKGLTERVVLYRHAFRNAAIPVVTILGINVGHLLGGSLVIEHVFAYPGMGRLAYQAILNRDFPLIQAFVLFLAVVVVTVALVVDLLYTYLDPRIRL
jgi:peptide/nickel transport system permease protein